MRHGHIMVALSSSAYKLFQKEFANSKIPSTVIERDIQELDGNVVFGLEYTSFNRWLKEVREFVKKNGGDYARLGYKIKDIELYCGLGVLSISRTIEYTRPSHEPFRILCMTRYWRPEGRCSDEGEL